MNLIRHLHNHGFTIIPEAVPHDRIAQLTAAYDHAVETASSEDKKVGNTSTRVSDFVNRGPEFDDLYLLPSLLEAARLVIGHAFKLSSYQARTLHVGALGQGLHVDVPRNTRDWPLLGFIYMIDEFRADNGATQFVPGSQHWEDPQNEGRDDPRVEATGCVLALGSAGSLLIFNGSTWHGHTSNTSTQPRRSLQGAFIPRDGRAGTDFNARMSPETGARLSLVAHQVLAP